ncbi:hypothetical protein BX286_0055 [Streptomyces sp. 3211.6]|uniref:hypothetical protein n=1 Tax=Streptomyces sp. 3211.6 TaxID=1938845 RepID=UPI000EAE87BC|nr:hypothetical protein [Streptomyces sp. 3211.6]RKT02189.1 hypothetical protein BX286_0055 [Streptomyces sp. 3211.6]
MYVMKLLGPADTEAVDKLIDARMDFQVANCHRPRGEGLGLRDTVTGAICPKTSGKPTGDGKRAIGMWEDGELLAAFVLQHAAPRHGWTPEERDEPTLQVSHAYALPDQPLLGRLAALWLSDYAARQTDQPWIRCAVREQALAWRLARRCGWRHVRDVNDTHGTLHLMQRPPERAHRLEAVVSSEGVPDLYPAPDRRLPA